MSRRRKRLQRLRAINQAEIAKQFRDMGPITEGHMSFKDGVPRDKNPHDEDDPNNRKPWFQGWDFAKEKADE